MRLGATLGVCALALLTEPVQQTLALGQVNLLLMLLVVADLLNPDALNGRTRWWHGIGIGLAAGVKLTPLIFIPYLLLIRRYRQAATAAGVFAATVALGYGILPRDSGTYWLHGLFLNANRIVFLGTRGNQSLRGVLTRLAGSVTAGTAPWIAAAILVVILGLAAAAVLYRAGHPVPGMLACALTGLLASPLSWDHHWVWVAPGIALLAHLGAQARGVVRAAWWAGGGALVLVFGAWPQFWDLSQAGLTPAGLFWYGPATYFATGSQPWYHEFHWHGLQLLAGNSFVLAGLAALAALCVAAIRLRSHGFTAGRDPAHASPGTTTSLLGVTDTTGKHLETEQKYDAAADFVMPDLAGLGKRTKATGRQRYYLSATYFDTDELDLIKNRITLRRRVGGPDEGWHLKLPVRKDTRQEIRTPLAEGDHGTVPARLAAQVQDVTAGRPLHPIAILDTERTVVTLADRAGKPLAEVADDLVTAARLDEPGAEPMRWREIEVEAVEGAQAEDVLEAAGQALRESGARRSTAASKLSRLLGTG